jgi:hypothetical protein
MYVLAFCHTQKQILRCSLHAHAKLAPSAFFIFNEAAQPEAAAVYIHLLAWKGCHAADLS